MQTFLKKYLFLLLALACFLLAALLEKGLINKHPEKMLVRHFQRELSEKEAELAYHMEEINETLNDTLFYGNYLESFQPYNDMFQEHGYGFLIFKDNQLVYWSDRSISFTEHVEDVGSGSSLMVLDNGYYLKNVVSHSGQIIIGLILLKNNYPHENKYLENTFHKDFILPANYVLEKSKGKHTIDIISFYGDYLFSVKPVGEVLCATTQLYIPGLLYLLGLILLFAYFRFEVTRSKHEPINKLSVLAVVLFLIYWLHIILKIPGVFYSLEYFSPGYFAYNLWLPSLGDYFLLSLFFFFWALNFNFDLKIRPLLKKAGSYKSFVAGLFLFFCGMLFIIVDQLIYVLVYNSSISFSLNRINDITAHSVVGFVSIALFLLSLFSITVKVVDEVCKYFNKKQLVVYVLGVSIVLAFLQILFISHVSIPILLAFISILILLGFMGSRYLQKFTLSYLIIFISIITLYSLVVINTTVIKKKNEAQELLSVNLVAERDLAAEILLYNAQEKIRIDPMIPKLLVPPYADLEDYITNTYFTGYFGKYDLQITTCEGADDLMLEPDNEIVDCFPFFEEMIVEQGQQIGSNFYFMDRMNGRISYFGKLHYPLASDSLGVAIFIDLISTITSEGLGYPELLLDRSMEKPAGYKNFSYAKYYDSRLVNQHGEFLYNHFIESYDIGNEEQTVGRWDNYRHVVYRSGQGHYVIVSREVFGLLDYLISFPYLFVFYFLLSISILFIGNQAIRQKSIQFDLRFKIQASIIIIVFISLLVVAVSTIFYNVEEYRIKHQGDLEEKMKSIAEEIDMRLKTKDIVDDDLRVWMYRELAKLSNIFRTDINIFDTDGSLMATSREEVYSKGLISSRINTQAYYELFHNYKVNYFQPEQIGSLSYLSAYEPIINNKGNYLGFINLPYFTRQDKYSQEISTFIVAFINLYVILFLASIITAVFISNQITRPLILIRENLRKIELGKRNEPINYRGNDEIGVLAKEYNKKVDELSASAELLARSERESAWREMAKQIAHEIKNPLTPMKLNIQHLQRTFGEGDEKNEYLERVTKTLIEQIENLSAIATEFSNFAKIPTARNQVFNLSGQIRKVIDLFETHDKASISFQVIDADAENVVVNADREQLSRAVINLVKNGIQAIPPGIKGDVRLRLRKRGHYALIEVSDNGVGIAEELRSKLFSPSFTTKSSGMGLGLSIVKSIVENFKGRIWFDTELNVGTTFFVEIPVFEYDKADENYNT